MPPPPSITAVDDLRWVAALLVEHGGERGARVARRIGTYLAGAAGGLGLDLAMELAPRPGESPWYEIEMLALRDSLICRFAHRFYADEPSERQQAQKIATSIGNYEAGAWIRDRVWKSPPPQYAGKAEALMFAILKAGRAPSARTVQRVLAASRVCHELPAFGGTPLPAYSGP
jgi:hypothetical protein